MTALFMITLIYALFGLIAGSFLNVVILRFPERSLGGRSSCPTCGYTLEWYDLVPVFSWLVLRGRCRKCRTPISIQYPLVEAATALLFAGIGGGGLGAVPLILSLAIASLLICIFVYDLYHHLIPDIWVYPFCALALILGWLQTTGDWLPALLAGPIAALPILFLWYLSKPFTAMAGQWMGFGDVKLALGMGWLLGFPFGIMAIFLAFIIGAVVSICILLPLPYILSICGLRAPEARGGYTMKSEVPFGPFLIASCLIVWFLLMYHVEIPLW